jgi:chromosomal replication initiation ATPase DnaA
MNAVLEHPSEVVPLQRKLYEAAKARRARQWNAKPDPIKPLALPAPVVSPFVRMAYINAVMEAERRKIELKERMEALERARENAHSVLDNIERGWPSVKKIIQACAAHFNVSSLDIISGRRPNSIVIPRQVAMFLARHLTPHSFPEIGRRFGGRDHTTILYGVHKIENMLREDEKLRADVDAITAALA